MFTNSLLKELTAAVALVENNSRFFLDAYRKLRGELEAGKHGTARELSNADTKRYPFLSSNYEFLGVDGDGQVVFESSYDYESTSFARFPLADVLTGDGQREFFAKMQQAFLQLPPVAPAGEDKLYSVERWKMVVADGQTTLGYEEWAVQAKQFAATW